MGLIDVLMQQRMGMAPQAAALQGGQMSPVPGPGQSAVSGAPVPPPAPPGLGQRLAGLAQQVQDSPLYQSTLGDEDWRARKALALNSMRLQPDPSLAAGLREQLQSRRELRQQTQQANRTADVLEKAGEKQMADAIRANPAYAGQIYTEYLKTRLNPQDQYETYRGSDLGLTGEEAEALYRMNTVTNKLERVGGAGTTISVGAGEKEMDIQLAKGLAEQISADANLATGAQDLLATVSQLEALSPYVGQDVRALPGFLRNALPEGMSETIDAYRSQLNGLVGALRVAGTGSQSDREMLNMLARGGSISTSPEARAIAHSALRQGAERNLQLAQLATQVRTGQITPEQYAEQRQAIVSAPLFTDEQRQLVARLEAVPDTAGGRTVTSGQEGAALRELRRRAEAGDAEAVKAIEMLRRELGLDGSPR